MNAKLTLSTLVGFLASSGSLSAQTPQGAVLWTFEAGGTIQTSPALAPDGTVYIATLALFAVTNNGAVASNKWTFPAALAGSPALGLDGTIYFVGGYSNDLYAVSPAGLQNWTFSSGGGSGSPALGFDSTIYFVAHGRLYAMSPSGKKRRDYLIDPSAAYLQSPIIGADKTIYLGLGRTVYAFSPDGTNKWSAALSSIGSDSPAVGSGGSIFSSAGSLYAFGADGSQLWSTVDYGFGGSSAVGKDGTIYAVIGGRALYAVTPGGGFSWHVLDTNNPQYGQYTAPAVDAGGTVYYCVSNSLWAISPQGYVQWKITNSGTSDPRVDLANTSPIVGPDGTIYAALGSTLYAIASGTNGPARSPWPMYRQNVRHTGKVEKPLLNQPQRRSDANFQFQLYAQVGETQMIQTSTDLAAWISLTNMAVIDVPMDVVDLSASNFPSRFYRTVSQ